VNKLDAQVDLEPSNQYISSLVTILAQLCGFPLLDKRICN